MNSLDPNARSCDCSEENNLQNKDRLFPNAQTITLGVQPFTSLHLYHTQSNAFEITHEEKGGATHFLAHKLSPKHLCVCTPTGLPQAYWDTGFFDTMQMVVGKWKNLESITWHNLSLQIPYIATTVPRNRYFFRDCPRKQEDDDDWCKRRLGEIVSQLSSLAISKPAEFE